MKTLRFLSALALVSLLLASCKTKEKEIPVSEVRLSETTHELTVGEDFTLKATVLPDNATDKSVTWTCSPESVISVAQNGKVTGIAPGTGTVTVTSTDGGRKASCTVKVKEAVISVQSVSLSQNTLSLAIGEDTYLTATVLPENATDKSVTWSCSPENVLTVYQSGQVVAKEEGEGTVTVTTTDGGRKAECKVYVRKYKVNVESVSLDQEILEMTEGDELYLTATVLPEDASEKKVVWSCEPESVLTVYQSGQVVAMGPGEGTVTVTTVDGGFTASCAVTVTPKFIEVESITLEPEPLELEVGQSAVVKATVLPEDATDKTLSWESSNEAVATVDQTGKVTALKAGETTLTVKAGHITAWGHVTVTDIPVTGVTVSPALVTLKEGETCQLSASVSPASARQDVEWASQNKEVATVDKEGLVTAVRAGSTRIYARSNAFQDQQGWCEVTVNEDDAVKGISLSSETMTIQVGESRPLTVTFTPSYAANQNVSWGSDTPGVATVSQEGMVMGFAEGEATITATSEDGGFTASCRVTVTAGSIPLIYYWMGENGCYVNGMPDPRNTMYDYTGDWTTRYLDCYGIDSRGKTLYTLEKAGLTNQSNHVFLCKDRAPYVDIMADPYPNTLHLSALSVQDDFFAILNPHYIWSEAPTVWRCDYAGHHVEIPVTGSFTRIYNPVLATHPDGRIFVCARIYDSYNVSYLALYTITTGNEVIEQRLFIPASTYQSMAVAEEGDVYVISVEDVGNVYRSVLFKNGEKQDGFDEAEFAERTAVACQGGHVYTAFEDDTQKEIRIRKDGELIYTIPLNSSSHIQSGNQPLVVTPSGDVYIALSGGQYKGMLYKNGELLYSLEAPHGTPFLYYMVIE